MRLSDITAPGDYWAIDSARKHHPCKITMTPAGAIVQGLTGKLKIVAYIKREPVLDVQYQARKKIL